MNIIKVCGLNNLNNINEISKIEEITHIGAIFYEKSPRFVKKIDNKNGFKNSTKNVVGVFVNSSIENILKEIEEYNLNSVQLHGNESPEFCKELSKYTTVYKAIGVDKTTNFNTLKNYENYISAFIFDTKYNAFGGSGNKFDWEKLEEYNLSKNFLLSGGISPNDFNEIKRINHKKICGIDLNSKFEITPGQKDILAIKTFVKNLKYTKQEE